MMMGSLIPPPSLSLDLRPTFVPKTVTDLLYDVSMIDNANDKLLRLDDFVTRLEEESTKIDAFRRELPLSMLLLNDAILVLKEESAKFRTPNSQPVLEEFMPLNKECDQKEENECSDKKNWMSSVQLWNSTVYPNAPEQKQHYQLDIKKSEEEEKQPEAVGEDPFQSYRNINGSGVFMPFTAYPAVPTLVTKEEKEEYDINGLSLQTPGFTNLKEGSNSSGSRISSGKPVSPSPGNDQPTLRTGHANRKQRRCWSPELHRRFVSALHQLGGSQAATPKQIRELMQVDGLTNDEVKSHLQKYRLHTRRTPASSAAALGNQTFPFLGGSWLSRDPYNDFTKSSISGYGSPQGPLQLAAGSRGGSSRTEDDTIEDDEVAKSREL